ncbi:hypothetical protein [Spiroplasma culicicola]|uniref:Uncharacterized protein n=1 Tax=Spiroplasma culicicola AES-1 TaxID=1276246 RepID=W6A756_9MOLU|nr:hypothetical protein [Spiroplasma culicicola]AHI52806.1 hypothetical protein SCULI_v1c04650 [Spiroplasma culicicola AES-1]
MEVREKANILMVYLNKDEELITSLQEVIRKYMLIDAKVSGHGFFNRIEYGILTQSDPIFFSKNLVEKFVTSTILYGVIDNRELSLNINAIDEDKTAHLGKLISAHCELETIIILDIWKTE